MNTVANSPPFQIMELRYSRGGWHYVVLQSGEVRSGFVEGEARVGAAIDLVEARFDGIREHTILWNKNPLHLVADLG